MTFALLPWLYLLRNLCIYCHDLHTNPTLYPQLQLVKNSAWPQALLSMLEDLFPSFEAACRSKEPDRTQAYTSVTVLISTTLWDYPLAFIKGHAC